MKRKSLYGALIAVTMVMGAFGAAPAQAAGTAKVNVVHGIPGLTVDVCVDGTKAIPSFMPGDVVTGVALPAGDHALKVVAEGAPCSDAGILNATATLVDRKNYTVVANLDADGTPNLKIFTNKVKPTGSGQSRLTVRHTAAAPAVNVWANGMPLITGTDFTWGHSATLAVPKGIYAAWVSLPGEYVPVIGPAVLKLRSGFAYQVYAYGSGTAGYNFAVVALKVGS